MSNFFLRILNLNFFIGSRESANIPSCSFRPLPYHSNAINLQLLNFWLSMRLIRF